MIILSAVQSSPFYSVIVNKASDPVNDEQLAISLKYLTANSEPQEKFLSFTECVSGVSGEALAGNILKHLSDWALDLTFLRGQAYDGAGAKAGCSRGIATCIGSYTDIARAHHDIDQVKRQVRENHDDLNKFHSLVYKKACDVARDIHVGVQEDMPRTTSHQQHRSNPPYETPKDYYHLVITAPMLDHLVS